MTLMFFLSFTILSGKVVDASKCEVVPIGCLFHGRRVIRTITFLGKLCLESVTNMTRIEVRTGEDWFLFSRVLTEKSECRKIRYKNIVRRNPPSGCRTIDILFWLVILTFSFSLDWPTFYPFIYPFSDLNTSEINNFLFATWNLMNNI